MSTFWTCATMLSGATIHAAATIHAVQLSMLLPGRLADGCIIIDYSSYSGREVAYWLVFCKHDWLLKVVYTI